MEGRSRAPTGLLDPCRGPRGVRAHEEPKGARRDRVRVGRPAEGRLEDGSGSTPGTPGRFRRGRPEAATGRTAIACFLLPASTPATAAARWALWRFSKRLMVHTPGPG